MPGRRRLGESRRRTLGPRFELPAQVGAQPPSAGGRNLACRARRRRRRRSRRAATACRAPRSRRRAVGRRLGRSSRSARGAKRSSSGRRQHARRRSACDRRVTAAPAAAVRPTSGFERAEPGRRALVAADDARRSRTRPVAERARGACGRRRSRRRRTRTSVQLDGRAPGASESRVTRRRRRRCEVVAPRVPSAASSRAHRRVPVDADAGSSTPPAMVSPTWSRDAVARRSREPAAARTAAASASRACRGRRRRAASVRRSAGPTRVGWAWYGRPASALAPRDA